MAKTGTLKLRVPATIATKGMVDENESAQAKTKEDGAGV